MVGCVGIGVQSELGEIIIEPSMNEFDELVEKFSEFPSLDTRFAALEYYVSRLSEFINVACDQTEIRLKAHANREKDPVAQAEIESEVHQLNETGRLEFSSTICGSVLVTIYFAYEASVINIFNHIANIGSFTSFESFKKKQGARIKGENNGKLNFLLIADAYSREVMGLSLVGKPVSSSVLEELRVLRNSYVHNGCSLDGLSQRIRENMTNGKYKNTLGQVASQWYITPEGVSIFFKETYESFKCFQRQAFDKAIT